MKIHHVIFLPEFRREYERLNSHLQRQVDYVLEWILHSREFPIQVATFVGSDNIFEITVPSDSHDLRLMAFVYAPSFKLYLPHSFFDNEQTNANVQYILAEKIRDEYVRNK